MFAFAIGIPEEDETDQNDDDKDGEVQYSPVLFHIDLCCLIFGILDHEYLKFPQDEVTKSKQFLVDILLTLIKDCPIKDYLRQVDSERKDLHVWLNELIDSLEDKIKVDSLMKSAVASDFILYSPDIVKKRKTKKYRGKNTMNKRR